MDKTTSDNVETADRDLNKLSKDLRKKVDMFLQLSPEIFVTEGQRNAERQNHLYTQKLSFIDGIKQISWHQRGKAIDIAFRGNELYPKDMKKWRKIANNARDCGLDWGYDLWNWDKAHFQDDGRTFEEVMRAVYIRDQIELNSKFWTKLEIIQNELHKMNEKFRKL